VGPIRPATSFSSTNPYAVAISNRPLTACFDATTEREGDAGLLTDIVHRLGPDSIVSLTAATIYGSTETTFYVAAVYFGAVGIKQTRHAIPVGLLADLTGVIASGVICRATL
jgi:spore maturation protein SpmB